MTIGGRGIYVIVVKSGARRSYVSTTGEKINAGKVLSCVYLLLDISPSTINHGTPAVH
ncbi:MAG: hypothetical protein RIB93_01800 [Coleofasciculus sp. D1-CHI-01]|uniref:hypothetical protein n=1 Tax=Coleofasciculus sp. D1-CHI-01 TaxID=3068482 RepID=UPI0033011BBA